LQPPPKKDKEGIGAASLTDELRGPADASLSVLTHRIEAARVVRAGTGEVPHLLAHIAFGERILGCG
jgi:hypothetical protein